MKTSQSITGLLGLVAVLLTANLVATLMSPAAEASSVIVPKAEASNVLRLDSKTLVTTNQAGDQLVIWQLGRFVDGAYEDVEARTYDAATSRR